MTCNNRLREYTYDRHDSNTNLIYYYYYYSDTYQIQVLDSFKEEFRLRFCFGSTKSFSSNTGWVYRRRANLSKRDRIKFSKILRARYLPPRS